MTRFSFSRKGGELRLSNQGQLELLRATIERGVSFRTRVRGSSMVPFIRDDDVLSIAPLYGRKPRIGQVIAFVQSDSGRLTIHRVIAGVGTGWLVCGDNSPEADGVIACENIIGRVTRVERQGRTVHLGLGAEARVIAWLARRGALMRLVALGYFPRRVVSALLRRAQGLRFYRIIAKLFPLSFDLVEASAADLAEVSRYLNPDLPPEPPHSSPNATNWVVRRKAKVIGFVQFVRHLHEDSSWTGNWLFSLRVWTRYRGRGIGERLVQRVIAQAVAAGAPELLLVVFEDNARAIALYRKLGFEQVTLPALEPQLAAEKHRFGRRRVVMRKILQEKR